MSELKKLYVDKDGSIIELPTNKLAQLSDVEFHTCATGEKWELIQVVEGTFKWFEERKDGELVGCGYIPVV